ncbi:Golgi-associated plant pathogenesis-related protein 1-like [Athalia rosae]|uniref:Golgi-associated plant pathogenesis-related protein 1-like n=1 Tax=Athalia rosae TaxID=37344 RepID=UPI0020344EA0|nr:Golgi-associated plant pathogenesis-related protein 1-like [Athalia rosae]
MKRLKRKFVATEFGNACLRAHNKYRAIHGSPDLLLSPEISSIAQEWADQMAENNSFEKSRNSEYGENLFTAFETNPKWRVQPSDPVKAW